ncbi:hypothetical protein DL95DRAFT_386873 [Leptodontidium sp. 2 PMI_412]|nr:hypothetical protein DL95DRAFT_386873 [Leptodontidium sp. 2 PMI_412]
MTSFGLCEHCLQQESRQNVAVRGSYRLGMKQCDRCSTRHAVRLAKILQGSLGGCLGC